MPRPLLIILLALCGMGLLLFLSWHEWGAAGFCALGCFVFATGLDRVPQ